MTNRGWPLVLLSNLAYLGLAGGSSITYTYFPDSGCGFELWSRFLKFAVYGFSLVLRAWIFAFKYHTAQSQVNENVPKAVRWCLKRKWLISPWFLGPLWVLSFLIHCAFPLLIMLIAGGSLKANVVTSQCTTALSLFNWIIPSLYAIAVSFLMFTLRLSDDGYHIRDELRAVAIFWIVGSVLWLVTNTLPDQWMVGYYVPGFFWLQLSFIASFVISTIWVWNLSRQHGASCFATAPDYAPKEAELGNQSFQVLLRDDAFRKEFSNFLCLQFCVENLFFWEAVQQFHSISPQEMKTEAKAIFDKYLASGSTYEVNISVTSKKTVEAHLKEGNVFATMFDEAAHQTLKLMEFDTYPRFVSRPGGFPLKAGVKAENSKDKLMK